MIRHAAALTAVRRANTGPARTTAGERDVTLAAVADRGDPVAVRAIADAELAPVLTLLPVDDDILSELAGHGPATIPVAQRARDAEALGTTLPTAEAIALLQLTSSAADSMYENFLAPFATAAGQAASDPETLLAHLPEQRFRGDAFLLGGVASRHAEAVGAWLFERLDLNHFDAVELGLDTTADLPLEIVRVLYRRVIDLVTTSSHGPSGDDLGNGASIDGEHGEGPTVPALGTIQRLADRVAWWLGRRSAPPGERLAHLSVLGLRGPDTALGKVAMSIGQALQQAQEDSSEDDVGPRPTDGDDEATRDLRRDLVAVLRRSLELDDFRSGSLIGPLHGDQYLVASGAVPLMVAAPQEMAQLLHERTRSHPQQPVPLAWRDDIVLELRERSLAVAADALEAVGAAAAPAGASVDTQRAALDLLRLLRGEEAG